MGHAALVIPETTTSDTAMYKCDIWTYHYKSGMSTHKQGILNLIVIDFNETGWCHVSAIKIICLVSKGGVHICRLPYGDLTWEN